MSWAGWDWARHPLFPECSKLWPTAPGLVCVHNWCVKVGLNAEVQFTITNCESKCICGSINIYLVIYFNILTQEGKLQM